MTRGLRHGGSYIPEYDVWVAMKQRCQNPKNARYKDYGGRGITICSQWERWECFIADMGRRPDSQHSLERKDNNGNYEPNNCVWATRSEQQGNKRSKLSEVDKQRLFTLHDAGWSQHKIAAEIGISQVWVGKLLRREGIQP